MGSEVQARGSTSDPDGHFHFLLYPGPDCHSFPPECGPLPLPPPPPVFGARAGNITLHLAGPRLRAPKEGGEASRTSVWGGHGQWYASMFEGIVLVLWERSGVGWWRGVGVDQDGRDQDGRGGPY